MSIPAFKPFSTGYRLIDGAKLNRLFQGQESYTPVITGGTIDGAVIGGITPAAATHTSLTVTGANIYAVSTVAAAGASQGTATQIPAGANTILITVTASTEGVKLPTAVVAGRSITIFADTAKGCKVYPGSAGQSINAATTATTAFALVLNTSTEFIAVSTTKWRTVKGG